MSNKTSSVSGRASLDYLLQPGGSLQGVIRVPGDKSVSHRALMLAAIAEGQSGIDGFLQGEDTLATMTALSAMGVVIQRDADQLLVDGVGLHGLSAPGGRLDLGNSGTSARLMTGLLAGQAFDSVITGDVSLVQRPMQRITEPLSRMGAVIETSPRGTLPLRINGRHQLHGIDFEMPVASAQVKSCLLLAGLYADGKTCVTEPRVTRDHTERMLRTFGCKLHQQGRRVCLQGGPSLKATNIKIPADMSSAAFFMVGASIAPGSMIRLVRVGVNPTRDAVIKILRDMGADITILNTREDSGEPIADIEVRAAPLHGIDLPEDLVAIAIDEIPAIMVAAAFAEGTTRVQGASELRVKESDRIEAIADGLRRLGIKTNTFDDGLEVKGGAIQGGAISSFGDHRIAMAFSMAALRANTPVRINDCANVATSFPGFPGIAANAGLRIRIEGQSNGN